MDNYTQFLMTLGGVIGNYLLQILLSSSTDIQAEWAIKSFVFITQNLVSNFPFLCSLSPSRSSVSEHLITFLPQINIG